MPPEASRFAMKVTRTLCSATVPSGTSSAFGRAPLASR
ncbi:Uncharacterised protein [Mycobacteroides abscessus subsp. abscessus]|nr:Uncharacterised protein [Mycobacteroides abscessus subsp. abscessus]